MKQFLLMLALALFSLLAFSQEANQIKTGEFPLSEDLLGNTVAGTNAMEYSTGKLSISSMLYSEYIYTHQAYNNGWGTYDIHGWDRFVGYFGISDDYEGYTSTITFSIDGEQYLTKTIKSGEKVVGVEIPLTGKQTLTIRWTNKYWLVNAKLIKGKTPSFNCMICRLDFQTQPQLDAHLLATHGQLCPNCGARFMTRTELDEHVKKAHGGAVPAKFVVEPNDLDKLATSLRTQVDAQADIKARMASAKVGITTFNLIDVDSPSVAQNAAEDLSTSLIKSRFKTVERGQLDKALFELKIQNSALISPETAKKIGQLTGCDVILVGSISDRGQFIVINGRFIDTASGETIASERVECRKNKIER